MVHFNYDCNGHQSCQIDAIPYCRIRIAFSEVPRYSSFNLAKMRKKYLRGGINNRNFFCFSSYSNHFGPVVESHVIFSILTISLELRSHQGLLNAAERRNIHPSSPPRISTKMSIIMAFSVNLYRVVHLWIVSIFYLDSIHQYSWRCSTMGLFWRKKFSNWQLLNFVSIRT